MDQNNVSPDKLPPLRVKAKEEMQTENTSRGMDKYLSSLRNNLDDIERRNDFYGLYQSKHSKVPNRQKYKVKEL